MKPNSNFERARALADNWPEWKRAYELTKDSIRASILAPVTDVAGDYKHERGAERKTASSRETK